MDYLIHLNKAIKDVIVSRAYTIPSMEGHMKLRLQSI